MNETEDIHSYKILNSLCSAPKVPKRLEEYQLDATTQLPGYLHEILGARIRTIDRYLIRASKDILR